MWENRKGQIILDISKYEFRFTVINLSIKSAPTGFCQKDGTILEKSPAVVPLKRLNSDDVLKQTAFLNTKQPLGFFPK